MCLLQKGNIMGEIKWSKETPTKKGYYWVRIIYTNCGTPDFIKPVHIDEKFNVRSIGFERSVKLETFQNNRGLEFEWMPLPKPEVV